MSSDEELINCLGETDIKLPVDVGIVGRFDERLLKYKFKRVMIQTKYGLMDRAFYGIVDGLKILVIYGRFDKNRTISEDINFEKTQAAFNAVGAKTIIGTFVTGGIQNKHKIGDVFIVSDLVGLGGFKKSLYRETGFKNADMYLPFCKVVRKALIEGAKDCKFTVKTKGIYACFHGFPRIETKAELNFYQKNGWDIVGQTLDPEATLARESGCCYAAVAVTIDDPKTRKDFLSGNEKARNLIQNAIPRGRLKTAEVVFKALKYIPRLEKRKCMCGHKFHSEKSHFRYLPDYILDRPDLK
jgi:5'-methylthioadenosine phosphorylase